MLFCLSISAIFCGCSEEDSNVRKNEPISFSAEICNRTQTRTAVDTSKHSGTNLIVQAAKPAKGITLNVNKMTRTSTADGYWSNGTSIAIQIGGTAKQYTVDGNGNITSFSPFYWANKNDVSVTSWFPYSASLPTTWSVNSDQSTETNYDGNDLLYASNTFTYDAGKSNTLKYSHETAKVVINVTRPGYVSDPSNIKSITIGTSDTPIDLSGAVGSDGSITAKSTNTGYITPYSTTPLSSNYSATYTALVIPQDMQNKQFIAIKVYNTIYYYKPTISTPLLAGHEYDYNITIPIEYYFSDGSWGALADHAIASVHPIGVVFSKKTSAIDQAHGWTHGYAMALTNASTDNSTNTCIWSSAENAEDGITYHDDVINQDYTYKDYSSGPYTTFNKDGYSETQVISKSGKSVYSQSTYPAIYYALNYATSGYYKAPTNTANSGWYLPSEGQWYDIYVNIGGITQIPSYSINGYCYWKNVSPIAINNINNYLKAVTKYNQSYSSPDLFNNNNMPYGNNTGTYVAEYYLSSSEYNSKISGSAVFDSNSDLYLNYDGKGNSFRIRVVIAF